MNWTDSPSATPPLLVDSKTAARLLSISERKLWELKQLGLIPHRRIGRAVRFLVSDLEAWIEAGCPCSR